MNDTLSTIDGFHRLYVQLTGFQIRLDAAREHEWFYWVKRGFTADDLRVLVAHLKREIKEGRRMPGCLKFRNLIVNLDYFEEDLAEARALARRPRVDAGRAEVLRRSGRDAASQAPARSAADVIAGMKAFEDFRKLKDNL